MSIQDLEVNLDLKQNLNIYATCKQLDNLNLICNIYDNSVQVDLENYNVRLKAMKADLVPLIQETNITVLNNVATIMAHEQLTTTSGKTLIELQFINKTTSLKKATFNLVLNVIASTLQVDRSISTSTYTLLEELENKLDQATDFLGNINEAIEANNTLKNTIGESVTAKSNLEADILSANNAISDLDVVNILAEGNIDDLDAKNLAATNKISELVTATTNAETKKQEIITECGIADNKIAAMQAFGDVSQVAQEITELNNEVQGARGGKANLDERLDGIDSSLSDHTQKLTEITSNYSVYASVKIGNFYTVVDFKRADATLYCKSTLSNADANGYFQTCTVKYYDALGTTITHTYTWTLTYDTDGKIISKVVA